MSLNLLNDLPSFNHDFVRDKDGGPAMVVCKNLPIAGMALAVLQNQQIDCKPLPDVHDVHTANFNRCLHILI